MSCTVLEKYSCTCHVNAHERERQRERDRDKEREREREREREGGEEGRRGNVKLPPLTRRPSFLSFDPPNISAVLPLVPQKN